MKLSIFFLAIFLCATFHPTYVSPQQITEEELKKLNDEVDLFRNNLSPQERAEFDAQVELLAKEMEKMDPKELEKFIDDVFDPNNMPQPIKSPEKEPAKIEPVVIQEPLYKPSTFSTKTIESARVMLTTLSASIESFLRKAHLIPDLFGKLSSWVPAAFMAGRQNLTWQELNKEMQLLNSNIKLCLALDPETGNYYHLASLLEQDVLYQHLVQLSTVLAQNESLVEAPAFGIGDITKSSRKATEAILALFTQSIYIFNCNKEFEKLFAGFDPQAKKVRDAEEASRKTAFDASKRPLTQAPTRASTLSKPSYEPNYQDVGSDYYSTPSYQGTSYSPSTPEYHSPSDSTKQSTTATKGKSSTKPEPGSDVAAKEAEAKKSPAKKEDTKELPKVDFEKTIERFETNFESALFIIKSKKLDAYITTTAKEEAVSEAATKMSQAISRIKVLKHQIKNLSQEQQRTYLDRVKLVVEDEKKLLDTIISRADRDNELRKEIEDIFKEVQLVHNPQTFKALAPQPTTPSNVTLPSSKKTEEAPQKEATVNAVK